MKVRSRLAKRTQRRRKPPKDLPIVESRDRGLATNAVLPPLEVVPAGTVRTLSTVVHSTSFLDKVTIPSMFEPQMTQKPTLKSEGVPADSLDIEELFMSKESYMDANPEEKRIDAEILIEETDDIISDESESISPKLLPSKTLMSLEKRSSESLARRSLLTQSMSEQSTQINAQKGKSTRPPPRVRPRGAVKSRTVTAPEISYLPTKDLPPPPPPRSITGSKSSSDDIPVTGIKKIIPSVSLSIDAGFDICSASGSSLKSSEESKSMTPVPTVFGQRRPDELRLSDAVVHPDSPTDKEVGDFPEQTRQRSHETRKSLPPLSISDRPLRKRVTVSSSSPPSDSTSLSQRESMESKYSHYQPHRPRRKHFPPLTLKAIHTEPVVRSADSSERSEQQLTPPPGAAETPGRIGERGGSIAIDEYQDQNTVLNLLRQTHWQLMRLQREAMPHVLSDCTLNHPWKNAEYDLGGSPMESKFRVIRLGGMIHLFGHITGGELLSESICDLPKAARPSYALVKFACMVEAGTSTDEIVTKSPDLLQCQICVNTDGRMNVSRCRFDLKGLIIILDGVYFPVF